MPPSHVLVEWLLTPSLVWTLDTVRVSFAPFYRVSSVSFPAPLHNFLMRILANGHGFILSGRVGRLRRWEQPSKSTSRFLPALMQPPFIVTSFVSCCAVRCIISWGFDSAQFVIHPLNPSDFGTLQTIISKEKRRGNGRIVAASRSPSWRLLLIGLRGGSAHTVSDNNRTSLSLESFNPVATFSLPLLPAPFFSFGVMGWMQLSES